MWIAVSKMCLDGTVGRTVRTSGGAENVGQVVTRRSLICEPSKEVHSVFGLIAQKVLKWLARVRVLGCRVEESPMAARAGSFLRDPLLPTTHLFEDHIRDGLMR